MVDFVCLGDATVDNFFFVDEAAIACDLSQENCTLNLKYGQKIPVTQHAVTQGGNAANVAVGLAKLGINAGLVTIFGDDEHGAWLKKQLLAQNVSLENCLISGQSNISAIIIFKGERTILSYHFPQTREIEDIPQANWLYLTSSPGTDSGQIFDLIKNMDIPHLAFNPAMTDLKRGKDFLAPVIEKTEVLILNEEEFEVLRTKGPKITVVTEGKKGATVYNGENLIQKPALGGPAYEPTGAGDSFSSGFLAAMFYGKSVEEALDWGLKNSASVIKKVGSTEGLLTKEQIQLSC